MLAPPRYYWLIGQCPCVEYMEVDLFERHNTYPFAPSVFEKKNVYNRRSKGKKIKQKTWTDEWLRCKMRCSESLEKLENQLDWSPGNLHNRKPSSWFLLNTLSGRRHFNNKAFPGSAEDTCWSAKRFIQYCTKLLHNMYTKILTLFCEVIPEHHGIASERQKKSIKVGCLRPAVTFSFCFISSTTDPCWFRQCH